MFERLIEFVLPSIIGVMVHKREILTKKERTAQDTFMAKLDIKKRKAEKPVIVALIGLVGSGKSSVAKELAGQIGATVIEGDDIRIELRKQNERYERTRAIAENAAIEVVKQGGNVVLDSDFIDIKKRASLRDKARKANIRLAFVCTYCNLDIMVGRIFTAVYHNSADDFFGGASSKWTGNEQSKGAVVKMREMLRRLPLHYRWENKGGGQWSIKNPPCAVLADIDTADPNKWKHEVDELAKKLLK